MKPGDRLADRYELVECIAEGGMGEVWRGEQIALGRAVAIKVIHRQHGESSPELRSRFKREAELAAKVEHRNVIDIIDYGITEDGAQYLVMPFLRGSSLYERLRRSPAPTLEDVVRWTSATLGGLAAIHDRGIIHRDLKPGNVFLAVDADGVVPKLLDFGISRSDASAPSAGLTELGTAIGTPQYMAPEQFESARDVDVRADLYGIGAMLYEAVTGAPPFVGRDAFAIYRALLQSDAAPIASVREDVPEALVALIERAIEKEPDARWQSARTMRSALDEQVAAGGLDALEVRPPPDVADEDIGTAATTPHSASIANAAATPRRIEKDAATDASLARTAPLGSSLRRVAKTYTGALEAQEENEPRREPSASRPAETKRGSVLLLVGVFACALVGALVWTGLHEETAAGGETDALAVNDAGWAGTDAGTGAETEPDTDAGADEALAGTSGILLTPPEDLNTLAMIWARVAPDDRGAEVRFVPAGGRWAIVAPASTPDGELAQLVSALGHETSTGLWDPDRGLTPTLARTRVRLNVHVDPAVDSPTQRVLPHDSVVVALYGHVDDGVSQDGSEEAMTYFAMSEEDAGWARADFIEPFWGCLPRWGDVDPQIAADPASLASDAIYARTRARTGRGWQDVWLVLARDTTSRHSALGVFEAQAGCTLGTEIYLEGIEGVIDEAFFTETARAGVSLVVFSYEQAEASPGQAPYRWSADHLDGARAWSATVSTAAHLPDERRGAVSGTRDRLLRNRRDGRVLALRRPGEERRFFRYEGGELAEISATEGE